MPRIKQTNPKRNPGIPRATFRRIVEEIAADNRIGTRFQKEAIVALHEESEKFIEENFHKASDLLSLWKTTTLNRELFQTAQRLAPVN